MSSDGQYTGSETVLVVDDNDEARNAMRRTLEWYGYRVLTADSPAAARDLVVSEGSAIDLLVTDVVMPQMTGPSLGRSLREKLPSLRILLVSGYADSELKGGEFPAGPVAFLEKPMTIRQLAAAVRGLLDRSVESPPGSQA